MVLELSGGKFSFEACIRWKLKAREWIRLPREKCKMRKAKH